MLNSKLFRYLLSRAIAAWLLGCGLAGLVAVSGVSQLSDQEIGTIALGSGVICIAAILPFSLPSLRRAEQDPPTQPPPADLGLFVAFSVGMGIRVVGTVALLLACRYQMDAPIGQIAAMIVGWYVYLTLVEIILVAIQSKPMSGIG